MTSRKGKTIQTVRKKKKKKTVARRKGLRNRFVSTYIINVYNNLTKEDRKKRTGICKTRWNL